MKTRVALAVFLLMVIVVALAGVRTLQVRAMIDAGADFVPPPIAVGLAEALDESWVSQLGAVGTVTAIDGITVRSEVSGVVRTIAFEPGTRVDAGDLLIELDRTVEAANLQQAEAELDRADRRFIRAQDLIKSGTISVSDLDDATAEQAAAVARVASLQATLDKKTIRAPFSGELGIRQISPGQYLDPGDLIVELQSLDQVYVRFSLPQQHLSQLAVGLGVVAFSNAYADETFRGNITAVNPRIDPATRNVTVQATFDNLGHKLRDGMYVSLGVVLPQQRQLVAIPATAVLYAAFGNSVFVVEETTGDDGSTTLVAHQRIIRLGITRGDYIEIVEGLQAGDRVVSAGAFKLRNGQTITVSDVGVVPANRDPSPDDS
ncbi:MAG: efflux RND transporter periplasmic adaptor subunit [Acidobacteriota bacterium]|nr:efflux RND transporter periplasmic adaptor subunit [Acidobacteriota bacterium]MDH3785189.1 efflux RND transporter periplasmic adaptor subunit [Acidobacteriota bacterium]